MTSNRSSGFLLFAIFVLLPTTRAQDKRLTMSGNVTDSRSHQPVEGAKVTVVGNKANPEITDRDGNFILTFSASTRDGEVVRVRVEKSGYKVYEVNKPVSPTMPLQFSIDRIARNHAPRASHTKQLEPTAPVKLEEPTFTELADKFYLTLGEHGMTFQLSRARLTLPSGTATMVCIHGFTPLLYLEGGRFYVDLTVGTLSGQPLIEIRHNQFVARLPQWDRNSNKSALEIVNENRAPVFQLIYKSPTHIILKGIFPCEGGFLLASDRVQQVSQVPPDFRLKRIFKYPAWKYPGEFDDHSE